MLGPMQIERVSFTSWRWHPIEVDYPVEAHGYFVDAVVTEVKLHWFQRQEDGRTVVTPADLDENGAYGDWPEDFDEVELDAEKAYLDAVESRGAAE